MPERRMLAGSVALALLMCGWVFVQGCWNRASPPALSVKRTGEPDPGTVEAPSEPANAAEAASPARPPKTADGSPPGTSTAAPGASGDVMVHVVGAVRKPGVYSLRAKARVRDALQAAGGARAGADLEAVNLASFVQDGEQIRVPTLAERRAAERQMAVSAAAAVPRAPRVARGGSPTRPTRSTARYPLTASAGASNNTASAVASDTASTDGPVNINTASAEELDTLPGVGPSTAAAILQHRREHGAFQSVEDLLQVPGIGEKKLAALRERVVVR